MPINVNTQEKSATADGQTINFISSVTNIANVAWSVFFHKSVIITNKLIEKGAFTIKEWPPTMWIISLI